MQLAARALGEGIRVDVRAIKSGEIPSPVRGGNSRFRGERGSNQRALSARCVHLKKLVNDDVALSGPSVSISPCFPWS